jgi:VanZ like family
VDAAAAARAWRIVFLASLVGTFVLALIPMHGQASFSHQDKVMHALVFAVLAWLGWRAGWRRPATLFGILVTCGLCIEVTQAFTPTRQAEFLDLLADAVGAGLAVLVLKRSAGGP